MLNVLYIDDEPINLNIFELAFRKDFNIYKSESPAKGIGIFNEENIDIVITDLKMPEMNGIEFIRKIKAINPSKKCILLTAYYEPSLANDPELQSIIFKYIVKPFNKQELKQIILDACP
ncbi:MAG: response regulator [Bacteroidales bacterium]|nr:response regulator [Bacteroidales bacterium]MBN2819055.1 response regulator [Bacteroidales bacterium]